MIYNNELKTYRMIYINIHQNSISNIILKNFYKFWILKEYIESHECFNIL